MKVYLHDGHHTNPSREVIAEGKRARWGTHTKAHVYETSSYSEIMIGTYNIHNRSEHFNTELAVFCKGNDELSEDVKEMILRQARNGLKVKSMIYAIDRKGHKINVTGASVLQKIKMKLFTIPSIIFSHLL
jgi:putative cardiolipin synthase